MDGGAECAVCYSAAAGMQCAKTRRDDDDGDGRRRGRTMARTSDGEERALAMLLSRKVSTRINESEVGRVASQTRKWNKTELEGERASCLSSTRADARRFIAGAIHPTSTLRNDR